MDRMDSIESKFSSDGGSYISQNSDNAQQVRVRFEQVLDNRLSCPVCLERFSDPRLLNCNHSFCKRCLVRILTKTLKNDETWCGVQCPKCRKVTTLGPGGVDALPLNYALQDVVEVMSPETSSFSPATPTVPFGTTVPASVPTCYEHQRPMEYFCKTDDQLVCSDCLIQERHRGHETLHAKEILENELELLRLSSFDSAECMLLRVRESVDTVSNMVDTLKDKGERAKLKIQKHFSEIRDALETREQSLLNTTDDIIRKKVTKLEHQKANLVKSRDDLEVQVLKLKHILASKDDYSFLKDKKKLLADVAQVVEIAQTKDRVPVQTTEDGPDTYLPDHLLSSAHTFGEVYCRPFPSKFTARGEGLSKGFLDRKAIFRIEARDRYGQRSIVGGTKIKVLIQDPNHNMITPLIEDTKEGEYLVTYTPTKVGYHLIRITADDVKIMNGDSHVVVFNRQDYFSLGVPRKFISKSDLRTEPPVSTMRSVCTLPSGLVVFTDAFCLRIVNTDTKQLITTIGSYGTANGQFSRPHGLAVNQQGHIFVSDTTNHRIQKFSSGGRHLLTMGSMGQKIGFLKSPEGIAVLGEEKLFVADTGNDRIQVFLQKTGKSQQSFGKRGTNAGQFSSPRDVAVDNKNGRLLVSDTGNFRIQALTFDGKPLTQFGNPKGGSVYLNYPYCVAVDNDGFILVTETRSHYVTILTPRGALVRHLGGHGDGPGQFKMPYGICVNSYNGQVIVSDHNSHCIQVF